MSVNGYLTRLASGAIIRDKEQEMIRRSIQALEVRLNSYFGAELDRQFIFGSFTRGTILPRRMDDRSDIDYMIVFANTGLRPQTYLDKLRRFVQMYYPSSAIYQSSPTMVLELNHIKFELVPAIEPWSDELMIPAKRSELNEWIYTDPNDFNRVLMRKNRDHENLIKPMVRLAKYWNAQNGYPFASFELEQQLIDQGYWFWDRGQLRDYLFIAFESLEAGWDSPQYKRNAIDRAQRIINTVQYQLRRGQESAAEQQIKQLLPATGLIQGALLGA